MVCCFLYKVCHDGGMQIELVYRIIGDKSTIWRSPIISELTLIIFNMELTHLGSEASICFYTPKFIIQLNNYQKLIILNAVCHFDDTYLIHCFLTI